MLLFRKLSTNNQHRCTKLAESALVATNNVAVAAAGSQIGYYLVQANGWKFYNDLDPNTFLKIMVYGSALMSLLPLACYFDIKNTLAKRQESNEPDRTIAYVFGLGTLLHAGFGFADFLIGSSFPDYSDHTGTAVTAAIVGNALAYLAEVSAYKGVTYMYKYVQAHNIPAPIDTPAEPSTNPTPANSARTTREYSIGLV